MTAIPIVRPKLVTSDPFPARARESRISSLWSYDFHNYVSTVGTAYAVMALKERQR